jgi:hypothetical protein
MRGRLFEALLLGFVLLCGAACIGVMFLLEGPAR